MSGKGNNKKEAIKIDPNNFRIHPEENQQLIRKSLVECGGGRSILLDSENCLIAGNGVYKEAQELGLPVRIIETDGTELIAVKRTDLNTQDEKRKLLAMADNRTNETSHFDLDKLISNFKVDDLKVWEFDIPFDDIPATSIDEFFIDAELGDGKKRMTVCPHCGQKHEVGKITRE